MSFHHSVIWSLCDSVILSFRNLLDKNFRHTFLRNCEAENNETWYTCGQWTDVSCIPESGCFSYLFLYFFIFLSLQFSNIEIFVTLFSGTVRPRTMKLGTHGQWTDVSCIPESGCSSYLFLYFFVFLSLQFSTIEIFHHTFLRNCEAKSNETWYTCGQWTDVLCILESGCSSYLFLYFFIFFLSNFQTLKFFITLFSGIVRPRRLKLGTHVDRCIVYIGIRLLLHICPFISSFFFLFNFLTLKFLVTLFSGTVRPRRLKLGTHPWYTPEQWADVSCIPQSGCCCLFVPLFFIFLSLQFSNMKFFHHTFLRKCEA